METEDVVVAGNLHRRDLLLEKLITRNVTTFLKFTNFSKFLAYSYDTMSRDLRLPNKQELSDDYR